MAKRFILTAFAQDRIGIVADITKIIYDNGCNLEDTEMTQLENEFVMMLLFNGKDSDILEPISRECRRLEKEKGISAYVRELEKETPKPAAKCVKHTILAEGIDHAGIIYKISVFLAKKGINIIRLESRLSPSPKSGTDFYTVKIETGIPGGVNLENLEHELSELGHEIEISMKLTE